MIPNSNLFLAKETLLCLTVCCINKPQIFRHIHKLTGTENEIIFDFVFQLIFRLQFLLKLLVGRSLGGPFVGGHGGAMLLVALAIVDVRLNSLF